MASKKAYKKIIFRVLTILISNLIFISLTYAQFPSDFQAKQNGSTYNVYFKNTNLLGTANAGAGCYLLDNEVKCFLINVNQNNGAMSCSRALFDKNSGSNIKPWSNFLCGLFSLKELITDSRTVIKEYDSALLPQDDLDALAAYYPNSKRITFSLNNSGKAAVFVYGTLKTTSTMFKASVKAIDNMIGSIKNPKLLKLLDGQRFVLINDGDTPSQMPGLYDLNMPNWIDTETRGASIIDVSTTIFSQEMNCKQSSANYNTPNKKSPITGPGQLVYFVAQTISDSLRLKSNVASAVTKGTFNDLPYIEELKNNQSEIFPIIAQAWFNANYSNPGPKSRTELLNDYPNIYNYLSTIFNNKKSVVTICPNLAAPTNNAVNYYNNSSTTTNIYNSNVPNTLGTYSTMSYRSYNPYYGFYRYHEYRNYYRNPGFIIYYNFNNKKYYNKYPNYRGDRYGRQWRDRNGNWDWSNKSNRSRNTNNTTVIINNNAPAAAPNSNPASPTTPAAAPTSPILNPAPGTSTTTDPTTTEPTTPVTEPNTNNPVEPSAPADSSPEVQNTSPSTTDSEQAAPVESGNNPNTPAIPNIEETIPDEANPDVPEVPDLVEPKVPAAEDNSEAPQSAPEPDSSSERENNTIPQSTHDSAPELDQTPESNTLPQTAPAPEPTPVPEYNDVPAPPRESNNNPTPIEQPIAPTPTPELTPAPIRDFPVEAPMPVPAPEPVIIPEPIPLPEGTGTNLNSEIKPTTTSSDETR